MNLVTTLCQLAAGGRAVVTTIHQPSSRLYQQLDKLLLLSDGHCMYYGALRTADIWPVTLLSPALAAWPDCSALTLTFFFAGRAALAAQWFRTLGFCMPYGVNLADFILDVASGGRLMSVSSSKRVTSVSCTASRQCCSMLQKPAVTTPAVALSRHNGACLTTCAGVVASSVLEAEGARAHLIACSEAYAAALPSEDGYRRPETLSENVLGTGLWSAARVRTYCRTKPGP